MEFSSALLESAVNEFAKLPGIGRKTALRLVLYLLKQEPAMVEAFGEAVIKMRKEIKFCQRCCNVSDADICSICSNSMRRQDLAISTAAIRQQSSRRSTQTASAHQMAQATWSDGMAAYSLACEERAPLLHAPTE